jgi:hypothetical protein
MKAIDIIAADTIFVKRSRAGTCEKYLKVTEIVFHDTCRATLIVEMLETEAFTTAGRPHIPRILFKLLPQMATQHCFNDEGLPFRREAQATEIPHLFEHLIIEIQNQVRRGIGVPLSGETCWNWTVDPRGLFYVTVDYDNELVALGAIRLAENVINALDSRDLSRIEAFNLNREISRLREIAKISRRFNSAVRLTDQVPIAMGGSAAKP